MEGSIACVCTLSCCALIVSSVALHLRLSSCLVPPTPTHAIVCLSATSRLLELLCLVPAISS